MSLIEYQAYGRGAGPCPKCGRETGNVAKHLKACERKHEELAAEAELSPEDRRAVERAVAHARHDEVLEPAARFRNGVEDLDVARLLRAIEAGTEVYQGGVSGWTVAKGGPLFRRGLACIVQEALRTGLVHAVSVPTGPGVRRVFIVSANVHLTDPWDNLRPACGGSEDPSRRYRLVRNRTWVDCRACLQGHS